MVGTVYVMLNMLYYITISMHTFRSYKANQRISTHRRAAAYIRGSLPSNEEMRALEDSILRWGKKKNMECENQFRVAGNTVTCKFKTSASTYCNKSYKLQKTKDGSSRQISNFTNHINAEHNNTKKVSTARPTTSQNQEESITAISTPQSGNEFSRKRKSTTSGITLFCS
jgi:hypothetical protein